MWWWRIWSNDPRGVRREVWRESRSLLVGQDQIPAVEAILASVGHDVARKPRAVLARMRDEETPTAAVDADDLGLGFHEISLPRGDS